MTLVVAIAWGLATYIAVQFANLLYVLAGAGMGWAAKVEVQEIQTGYGPPLFHRHLRGARFRIALFPLGGYTQFKEIDDDEDEAGSYQSVAPLIGMLHHERVRDGMFCRLALSALELDDTRKPEPTSAPRRFRFSLILNS